MIFKILYKPLQKDIFLHCALKQKRQGPPHEGTALDL